MQELGFESEKATLTFFLQIQSEEEEEEFVIDLNRINEEIIILQNKD